MIMLTDYVNKRWHSPIQANRKLQQLVRQVGIAAINSKEAYEKVRDTRTAMIVSLIVSQLHNSPTFLRIPRKDPPDAYLMYLSPINHGLFRGVPLEITGYFGNRGSLLEQLQEDKVFVTYQKYTNDSLLVYELHTKEGIDYSAINGYLKYTKTAFAVWTIHLVNTQRGTFAEVVRIGRDSTPFQVNVGENAYRTIYAGVHNIVLLKRAGSTTNSHIEDSPHSLADIAPWEQLED
jgi:hypothetical protein